MENDDKLWIFFRVLHFQTKPHRTSSWGESKPTNVSLGGSTTLGEWEFKGPTIWLSLQCSSCRSCKNKKIGDFTEV